MFDEQDPAGLERVTLVIHDPKTGYIRQVVSCLRRDAQHQGKAFKGHAVLDVTDTCPDAHPDLHMVDLTIKMLVDRIAPLEEVKAAKVKQLEQLARATIGAGFRSSATGRAVKYCCDPHHQTDFLHAVHVGGDLETHDGAAVAHTAEQGKAVLADFVKHRDRVRGHLAKLKARIEAAKSAETIHAIEWPEGKP